MMGKIISFSGIDGAGKSTQINLLLGYFKKQKIKAIATQDLFGYFLLKPIIKYLRKVTNSPSSGSVKKSASPFAKIWFIPAFIDIWVGYLFRIRPMIKKYDIIIADRTYEDIWVNLLYYGYLPDFAFKTFLKLLPSTDIRFFLKVSARKAKQRSDDDFPLLYFNKQIRIYNQVVKLMDFFQLDCEKRPLETFKEIKKFLDKRVLKKDNKSSVLLYNE